MEENKYKDALERAKSAIKECGNNLGRIKMIESIFSDELWESEDEQTRKQLLDLVHRYTLAPYSDRDRWVAYLEKVKDFDKQLEDAYKNSDEVQYKRGYDDGYIEGMAFAKQELEKHNEKPATISVDKMVGEFEDFRVISCGRIPSFAELDAYRKGVNDALSKILIKEEKAISVGSKKAEGKLGEMIAASKEPAESGEDKEPSHKDVTKKSDKVWSDEDQDFFGLLEGYLEFDYELSNNDKANTLDWLKSIKDRMQ